MGGALDVGEAERDGTRRQRGRLRRSSDAELVVLAEDQRLELAEARAGFDPEMFDQLLPRLAVGGERIGLAADPVQRGHEQRPEPLAERIRGGELGQRPDRRDGVGLDALLEVAFDGAEPLLDQPVDGRGESGRIEAGERHARPLGQRRLAVAGREVVLEAEDVDRAGKHVEAVRSADALDRVGAERLAQPGDVRLQRLVGGARRFVAPHHLDQT